MRKYYSFKIKQKKSKKTGFYRKNKYKKNNKNNVEKITKRLDQKKEKIAKWKNNKKII